MAVTTASKIKVRLFLTLVFILGLAATAVYVSSQQPSVVSLQVTWTGPRPYLIIYTVGKHDVYIEESQVPSDAIGHWEHDEPYVEGQFYAVSAMTRKYGHLRSQIFIDLNPHGAPSIREDPGAVRSYVNRPG